MDKNIYTQNKINEKQNIEIEIEDKHKYKFCKTVINVRKFCLLDSNIRDKENIECDIYTWLLKKINCDPNIDNFD